MVPAHLIVNAQIALSSKEMAGIVTISRWLSAAAKNRSSLEGKVITSAMTGDIEAVKDHAKYFGGCDLEIVNNLASAMNAKLT